VRALEALAAGRSTRALGDIGERMRASSVVISGLAITLVGTNIYWMNRLGGCGGNLERKMIQLQVARASGDAVRKLLPTVARPDLTRADIVAAAQGLDPSAQVTEEDGITWVGRLGFQFDGTGHLSEVQLMSAHFVD
jgi:hypothetical protein